MKTLFLFVSCILSLLTRGQNLVPNFSFEDTVQCPNAGDQADFAMGWSKFSALITTPDYFNECSPPNLAGVPQSFFFYQPDNRDCGGYMGMITWAADFDNYREQVGIQLSQPLVVGQQYFLSFYAVLGGYYSAGSYYEAPSNNIGMRLSTIPYNASNPAPIDNFAHVRSQTIISDTMDWVHVSGSILADSAYNFLILGNFYDDTNTDTTTLSCGNCLNKASYFLVDDVCVSLDSALCNGGVIDLSCDWSMGNQEYSLIPNIQVYPNPTNSEAMVSVGNYQIAELSLYDIFGNTLFESLSIHSNIAALDLSTEPQGLYFIKIRIKDYDEYIIKKVVRL